MTTKESENLSVMMRANTRFYAFNPWRRFLARMSDISIYSVLWSAFLAFALQINLMARSNLENIFDSFIAIAIMLVLEPLWLHLFGTTPGKAIFGLRIEGPEGRRLSYSEGLERTWGVIGVGMGYNIPIYNLIRLWKSYKLCSEKEIQPWDEEITYRIKDTKWYRGLFFIGASLALFATLYTISSAQQLPPNRGDLTVAEYVENYNYYARFFDIDFGREYLDENGRWAEKEFDGTVYIELGSSEKPEYHFTTENGFVTGVSFAVEIKNNEEWLMPYDKQMILASLAFAGAQNEMGLFSRMPRRIIEQIEQNTFKDFHFEEAGTAFSSNIDYSGYKDTQSSVLIPAESAAETYFNLKFSITK